MAEYKLSDSQRAAAAASNSNMTTDIIGFPKQSDEVIEYDIYEGIYRE